MGARTHTHGIHIFLLEDLGAFRFRRKKEDIRHGNLSCGILISAFEVDNLMNYTFTLMFFFLMQSELGSEKYNSMSQGPFSSLITFARKH